MLAQADAVAEERAAGEGAGGIDGEDTDGAVGVAKVLGEAVDEGAFAGAGRAGDADAECASGVWKAGGEEGGGFGSVVFDEGNGAGEGARVALAEAVDEIGDGIGGGFSPGVGRCTYLIPLVLTFSTASYSSHS